MTGEQVKEWYRRHCHNKLGYGYPTEHKGGDNFQPIYGCRFCSFTIAQDSQGNWFHLNKEVTP